MKVLVILTGGIFADGITSVWLSYCNELKKAVGQQNLKMNFLAIEGLCADKEIEKLKEMGFEVIAISNRLHAPIKYFVELVRLLKSGRYDAVHVNGSSSIMAMEMLAAFITNIPVRIAHSHSTQSSFGFLNKFLRPLFLSLCNARFACGEAAGKWLFRKKDFVIINNGKDFSKFNYSQTKRESMRKHFGVSDKIVIGHVGSFTRNKNQLFLLDVFEEFLNVFPNSILYLMGTGEMFENVQKKAKEKGLEYKIIFAGLVEDMPNRLQAMDVMVLPSFFEGLPNVVLEWQALGLPCLLSDTITKACAVSGLVEYESLENSPKIWAEHLYKMFKDGRERSADASQGVLALRKAGFDIRDNARFLYEQYCKLVNIYEK